MADQKIITLRNVDATPKNIVLYDVPVADRAAPVVIYLYGPTPPVGSQPAAGGNTYSRGRIVNA